MTDQQGIHQIIEQAKQQRAEFIGASVRRHPVLIALLVSVPVLLTQVQWNPVAPTALEISQNEPRTPIAAPNRPSERLGESPAATLFSPFRNK